MKLKDKTEKTKNSPPTSSIQISAFLKLIECNLKNITDRERKW